MHLAVLAIRGVARCVFKRTFFELCALRYALYFEVARER
jgi:hypothetical protein